MSLQQFASPLRTLENGHFTRAQALSLSLHIAVIALMLLPVVARTPHRKIIGGNFTSQPLAPLKWFGAPARNRGQYGTLSGSGHNQPDPPSKGSPPPLRHIQLMQPGPIENRDAAIMLPPSVFGPEDLRLVQVPADRWGIPTELEANDSRGPGEGGSYGRGKGKGIGNRWGDGYDGKGHPHAGGNGHGAPVCTYCPIPSFSDEAVKSRYQGKVLLRALITADGRVTNISIVRGLGMGLDENAIATVRTWRLAPARGPDGKPAAVWTLIEVIFRQH